MRKPSPAIIIASLALFFSLGGNAIAQPTPDPSPQAVRHHHAVMLPRCSHLPGVPADWWVTETVGGRVVCVGPNGR